MTSVHSSVITPPKPSDTTQPTGASRRTVTSTSAIDVGDGALHQAPGSGGRHRIERGGECRRVAQAHLHRAGLALVREPESLQRDRVADPLGGLEHVAARHHLAVGDGHAEGAQAGLRGRLVDHVGVAGDVHRGMGIDPVGRHDRRGVERGERLTEAEQCGEPARGQVVAERLVDALGHRGDDHGPPAGGLCGVGECIGRGVPRARVVVGPGRRVEDEHGGVLRAVHHRREAGGHRRTIAPHERVVVERVAHRHELGERPLDARAMVVVERLEHERGGLRTIGHQRRLAAGAAERHDPVAGEPTALVEQLQGLEQLCRGAHGGDAVALEHRVVGGGPAGHRAGVRRGDRRAGGGATGLQRHQRHALVGGPGGDGGEVLRIADGLEEQSDRGDAPVVEERFDRVLGAEAGLVADRDHLAEPQPSLLEREVDRDVAALGDDGRRTVVAAHAVLVGPQGDPVEGVDEAVAVGAEQRHVAGGLEQFGLEVALAGLGEPRAVADRAADALCCQRAHGGDGGVAVDAEEHRIRHLGQVVERRDAGARRRGGCASGAPARSGPGSRA